MSLQFESSHNCPFLHFCTTFNILIAPYSISITLNTTNKSNIIPTRDYSVTMATDKKLSLHSWDRLLTDKIEHKFKCHLCPYSSPWGRYLEDHIRGSHSDDKLYECDFCDKKFTRFASLGVHQRKHTQEKPYGCVHCKRRFRVSRHLLEHVDSRDCWQNSVPRRMRFECASCCAVFATRSYLQRHIAIVHGSNGPMNLMNPKMEPILNRKTLKVQVAASISTLDILSEIPPLERDGEESAINNVDDEATFIKQEPEPSGLAVTKIKMESDSHGMDSCKWSDYAVSMRKPKCIDAKIPSFPRFANEHHQVISTVEGLRKYIEQILDEPIERTLAVSRSFFEFKTPLRANCYKHLNMIAHTEICTVCYRALGDSQVIGRANECSQCNVWIHESCTKHGIQWTAGCDWLCDDCYYE